MNVKTTDWVAGGLALATIAGAAYAGFNYRNRKQKYRWGFNPETVEEVKGRVQDVLYTGSEESENRGLEMLLDIEDDVIRVPLGPVWFMKMQPSFIEPGDEIELMGSRMVVDDETVIVAETVKKGRHELRLRDETGHPVWSAWYRLS